MLLNTLSRLESFTLHPCLARVGPIDLPKLLRHMDPFAFRVLQDALKLTVYHLYEAVQDFSAGNITGGKRADLHDCFLLPSFHSDLHRLANTEFKHVDTLLGHAQVH